MIKTKLGVFLVVALAIVLASGVGVGVYAQGPSGITTQPQRVERVIDGRPPEIKAEVVSLPEPHIQTGINILPNVPAFLWSYGCSATAAAMMMGYYDNMGYDNMYTGPTNGGVCPMDNSIWGPGIGGSDGECPLSATHQGVDGRATYGHVDDYWVSYTAPDPYIGNWPEHTHGYCTGDFMGSNQYLLDNKDGGTDFFPFVDGSPDYDFTGYEPENRDGCHGMKLFAESRGYSVTTNFNQLIKGQGTDPNLGFTFDDYKAEIDAGRPVLVHTIGHTMLGFGYDTVGSKVYLHDTFDYGDHTMTWGGTYQGGQQDMVTVFRLEPIAQPTPTPTPTIMPTPSFTPTPTPTIMPTPSPTPTLVPTPPSPGTWSFCAPGFFPKHLPDSYYGYSELASIDLGTIPDEVQGVYWYDCNAVEWKFWAPGVPHAIGIY